MSLRFVNFAGSSNGRIHDSESCHLGSAPEAHPPPAENPIFVKMFYAYVLKSSSHGTFYVGSSEDPENRLATEHNAGKVRYTKGRMPWVLIYKESYRTRGDAMARERFFKSGQGRKWLNEKAL